MTFIHMLQSSGINEVSRGTIFWNLADFLRSIGQVRFICCVAKTKTNSRLNHRLRKVHCYKCGSWFLRTTCTGRSCRNCNTIEICSHHKSLAINTVKGNRSNMWATRCVLTKNDGIHADTSSMLTNDRFESILQCCRA